jgi:hypothetical protein
MATLDTLCLQTRTPAFILTYILPQCFNFNLLFIFIYLKLMLSHSPFYLYSTLYIFLYCTFLPYFKSLYIMLLVCHSICFTLHDMLYILMLLSVIYFRYTTHSHCISRNSEGSKKLPDEGRLLPKHVGASTQNKGCYKSVHIFGYF